MIDFVELLPVFDVVKKSANIMLHLCYDFKCPKVYRYRTPDSQNVRNGIAENFPRSLHMNSQMLFVDCVTLLLATAECVDNKRRNRIANRSLALAMLSLALFCRH